MRQDASEPIYLQKKLKQTDRERERDVNDLPPQVTTDNGLLK